MEFDLLHLSLEISVTACFFMLAWITGSFTSDGKYTEILSTGCIVAGAANILHIATSMWLPQLSVFPSAMLGNAPQFVIIWMFAIVAICDRTCSLSSLAFAVVLTIPIVGSLALDIYQYYYGALSIFSPVSIGNLFTIHYPLYLLTAAMFGAVGIGIWQKRVFLFPPYSCLLFFAFGIGANVLVAMISPEYVDMSNILAHGMKLAGYYSIIVLLLVVKYQFDMVTAINTEIRNAKIGYNDAVDGRFKQL